jgi:ABC-type branched-subunit amino acid transport system ATPase component
MAHDQPRLQARGVTVRFGGVVALSDVAISVPSNAIVGLVGPNGAGKSTLLGVLSGTIRGSGTITLDGADVTHMRADARARAGLARTFQHPEVFGELTVREQVSLAYRVRHEASRLRSDLLLGRGRRSASAGEQRTVGEILDLLGLDAVADRLASGLPLGTARLVEIARGIVMTPRVLLLDEPSSGLSTHETQQLSRALERVVAEYDLSVVLVEHDVDMVLSLSKVVYVLDFGAILASGTPAEIRANVDVRRAYLGEEEADLPASRHHVGTGPAAAESGTTPALLSVSGVDVYYGAAQALRNVSLEVGRGTVTAILGANGAGKSTLARAISGLIPVSSGTIRFDGSDVTGAPPHQIRRSGLAHLPEGRGIFPNLTVAENLNLAARSLSKARRAPAIARAAEMFPILGSRRRQLAGRLSGGEQQMLSFARVLVVTPKLVIADEVSLGLAPLIVDEVYQGIEVMLELGVSVLLIEQFVRRALSFASYCYIMRRGEVMWQGLTGGAATEAIGLYLGSHDDAGPATAEAVGVGVAELNQGAPASPIGRS